MLWRNRRNRLLCPVNALLWWLSICKIRSGYLFPSAKKLKELLGEPEDDNVEIAGDAIEYTTFLELIKRKLENHWKGIKWGTHSLRKTGFLLATWGGAEEVEIMKVSFFIKLESQIANEY